MVGLFLPAFFTIFIEFSGKIVLKRQIFVLYWV